MEIDARIRLPQAHKDLIKKMFAGYQKVIVLHEYGAGLSGSHVYQVEPIRITGISELPRVIKIDQANLMEREWKVYNAYIRDILSRAMPIQSPPTDLPDSELGGMMYELVGQGRFPTTSMQTLLEEGDLSEIDNVLHNSIFPSLSDLYEQSVFDSSTNLSQHYSSILPANFRANFQEIKGDSDSSSAFNREDMPVSHPHVGEVVQINAFVVDKVSTKNEWARFVDNLERPSIKFYIDDVPLYLLENALIGQPMRYQIAGRITQTRFSILKEIAEAVLPISYDLNDSSLAIDAERNLLNPLVKLEEILKQPVDIRDSIVHGDMNLNNILVDQSNSSGYFIDFAKARKGHVILDFLHLECHVVTVLLAKLFFKQKWPAFKIYEFYSYLHCKLENGKEFLLPREWAPAERYLTVLYWLRNKANDYLVSRNNWTEYYVGLTLYLLGVMKFDSLKADKTHPMPTRLAFWGAATCATFLFDGMPDCQSKADNPISSRSVDPIQIREYLIQHKSISQLQEIALALDIRKTHAIFVIDSKEDFVEELINHCLRRNKLRNLNKVLFEV